MNLIKLKLFSVLFLFFATANVAMANFIEEVKTPTPKELVKPNNEITPKDEVLQKAATPQKDEVVNLDEPPEEIEQLDGLPARSVRIDLQVVEGAEFYDVMVIPARRIWAEPLKFRVTNESPRVRLRLSPGKYSIQTRSVDAKKMPGRWSRRTDFWVQFRPILNAYPRPNEEIEPRSSKEESIVFEWPKVEKANYYFFRLKNAQGKILRMVITKQTFLRSDVKIDSDYSWVISPMSTKNEYKTLLRNDRLAPYQRFSVLTPDTDGRGTLIKITGHPKAYKYQFEVVGVDKTDETSQPSIVDSYDPSYRFRLPPGEYEMRARHIFPDETKSEWSPPARFFIKRFVPKLVGPTKDEEVESTSDDDSKVTLRWAKDETASKYKVFVFDSENKLILTETTSENFVTVKLPHEADYKWGVRAYSAREPASEMKPDQATGTFRINKYIPLEMNVAEEPSQFYGWAKHVSSMESYYGENYDNNSIVRQDIFGGEGEAAVGYWWRKTRFGVLAHASLAGFLYEGTIYNYTNYGLHLGYRHLLPNGDRVRVWLGVNYREIPEVLTHPFTTEVNYSKIKSMGPQLQGSFLRPIDDKWAFMATGSLFYSAEDRGTPLDTEQVPQLSYRLSLMGAYKYSSDIRLVGGYSYKVEAGAYYSADTPGAINKSQVSGHYLSLMLEYALEEKMK